MAESRQRSTSSGSGLLLSALGGAVVGAAGLGWWLLTEAERRRQSRSPNRPMRLTSPARTTSLEHREELQVTPLSAQVPIDRHLQDRVHQLNKAIDEVRRQLEQLQPLP
jgi:hypothetical protein